MSRLPTGKRSAIETWLRRTAFGLAAAAIAIVVGSCVGEQRWSRASAAQERMIAMGSPTSQAPVSLQVLDSLPPPVQRYLRLVLTHGQPVVRLVHLRQTGELRTDIEKERWLSFEATQVIGPLARGFVWDAKVRLFPLVHLRVRDAYVNGEGAGQVNLQSTITVAEERGSPPLNEGELYRFLAESVWYPTALLPGAHLTWSPIDDRRALATATFSGATAAVQFRFNDLGEAIGVYARRPRQVEHGYETTPWEGRFGGYRVIDGMRIPTTGEVGWHVGGQWRPVWRGSLLDLQYDFSR
jgi:hypothetical protein